MISLRAETGLARRTVLLTSPPQTRTVLYGSSLLADGNVKNPKRATVSFPDLAFVVRYTVTRDGFLYRGMSDKGLGVFFSDGPVRSLDQEVVCTPFDPDRPYACTDHNWDHVTFKTDVELIGTAIHLWWNSPHNLSGSLFYGGDVIRWPENVVEWIKDQRKITGRQPSELLSQIAPELVGHELVDMPVRLPTKIR